MSLKKQKKNGTFSAGKNTTILSICSDSKQIDNINDHCLKVGKRVEVEFLEKNKNQESFH